MTMRSFGRVRPGISATSIRAGPGVEVGDDLHADVRIRILLQRVADPVRSTPTRLEAEGLQLLVVGHAAPLQDVFLRFVHLRRIRSDGYTGAICVDMTPAAPRFRTASRQSAPSDPSPRTTAPLTSLPAKSPGFQRPRLQSVPSDLPTGVENELIARETRSCSLRQNGCLVADDDDGPLRVVPSRSAVRIFLDTHPRKTSGTEPFAGCDRSTR